MAGPGAAGVIAQAVGAVCGVLADAASFAVSAICLSRIRVAEPPRAARRRNLRHEIGEGLAIVARDPLLRASAIYGCLSNLTLVGYQAVLVVFLIRIVGLSAGVTGALIAVTSLGGVLGALLARPAARRVDPARRHHGRRSRQPPRSPGQPRAIPTAGSDRAGPDDRDSHRRGRLSRRRRPSDSAGRRRRPARVRCRRGSRRV